MLVGEERFLQGVKQCHAGSASAAKIRKRKLPRVRAPKDGEDGSKSNLCDFVVLEFMDGGSLKSLLRRVLAAAPDAALAPAAGGNAGEAVWPWRERLRVACDVAEAMQQMHAKSFVHRDLKSDNILVDGECRCKVADLGLSRSDDVFAAARAKKRRGSTASGSGAAGSAAAAGADEREDVDWTAAGGTPQYMSPAVIAEWQAAEAEPDEGDGDRRRARQKVVEGLGGEWLPREDERGRGYWVNSKTRATTFVDPKQFLDAAGRVVPDDGGPGGGNKKRRALNTWHAPDAYAFGVIMWEILSLRKPWAGLKMAKMWRRVQAGKRPEVQAHERAAAPAAYVALLERNWAQDGASRPMFEESVAALRGMLKAAGGVTKRKPTQWKKKKKKHRSAEKKAASRSSADAEAPPAPAPAPAAPAPAPVASAVPADRSPVTPLKAAAAAPEAAPATPPTPVAPASAAAPPDPTKMPIAEVKKLLPAGWKVKASKSRPGKFSYVNRYTREKIAWWPTLPASRVKGNLPMPAEHPGS